MTSAGQLLQRSDAGGTRTLRFDRPGSANALSAGLVDALHDALDDAEDDGVRLLVLRGNDRHFCAGFDLRDLRSESDATLLYRFCRLGLLLERLTGAPFSTVAVIEGPAVGAGADLAAACDHRIGSARASFRFPGAAFGVVLGVRRLAALIGQSRTIRAVSDGLRIDAADAYACGLLTLVADVEGLDAEVRRLSAGADRLSRAAIRGVLRAARPADPGTSLAELVRSLASAPGLRQRLDTFGAQARTAALTNPS